MSKKYTPKEVVEILAKNLRQIVEEDLAKDLGPDEKTPVKTRGKTGPTGTVISEKPKTGPTGTVISPKPTGPTGTEIAETGKDPTKIKTSGSAHKPMTPKTPEERRKDIAAINAMARSKNPEAAKVQAAAGGESGKRQIVDMTPKDATDRSDQIKEIQSAIKSKTVNLHKPPEQKQSAAQSFVHKIKSAVSKMNKKGE